MDKKDKTTYGLIISTLAFCVSWYFNHSVAWGIFHALLGGLYLAYKAVCFFCGVCVGGGYDVRTACKI